MEGVGIFVVGCWSLGFELSLAVWKRAPPNLKASVGTMQGHRSFFVGCCGALGSIFGVWVWGAPVDGARVHPMTPRLGDIPAFPMNTGLLPKLNMQPDAPSSLDLDSAIVSMFI